MSGGLLSLKWNNHCSTFLQILSTLHKKQTYHDATVACGGALYPVHKIVLSTCSEYFEEMFDSINDKHPIIVLKDIKGEVFEALLKYMYIGEVNVIQDRLNDLINAAECLKIKGLAVPDEDPTEGSSVRPNRSNSSNNNPSVSTKRRHEHSDSSNSQPPFKVHKTVKNVANSSKEPKNYREAEKERSLSVNSNEALFHEEDDDVIEEVPIKQEREEYEGEASSSKDKRPTPHLPNTEHKNEQEKESTSAAPEQTEDLSKVEILEEEDCGSNSADQWTGANLGDEDNFSYLGDSNSGAAEDIRPQDETNEGDNNEGMYTYFPQFFEEPSTTTKLFNHPKLAEGGAKQVQCWNCPYLALNLADLRRHCAGEHKLAAKDKPFGCTFCSYRTDRKYNLQSHMRSHTGECKYFCQYCPYKAVHSASLGNHMAKQHNDILVSNLRNVN